MLIEQGFELVEAVVSPEECEAINSELEKLQIMGAGTRNLLETEWCKTLLQKVRSSAEIAGLLPASHVAVQCTYFEKSQGKNWLVPLHQDLSIPVAERIDHPNLSGWSEKEGVIYVQPPLEVLENMVAVRVHLDPCDIQDGPLKVVPGSHLLGIITATAGIGIRDQRREVTCLATQGTAVVMRPLILHASSKATGQSQRRVLHFLFGPKELPHRLRWQTEA